MRGVAGKVVLFGATSGVGQPLSLLLKNCPHVTELVCCGSPSDSPMPAMGIAADLATIDTATRVRFALDESDWPAAVRDAQLVLVCHGSSFDPLRLYRDAALQATAPLVEPVMHAIAASASPAVVGVVSGPVNAIVPFCAEVLKREQRFDPRKLLGVTSLDVVRTRRLVAEALAMNPFDVNVPVVGGRGGVTACPLIAQTGLRLAPEDVSRITIQVQQYGSPFAPPPPPSSGASTSEEKKTAEVTLSSNSSTTEYSPVSLSLAAATCEFSVSVLKALRGDYGILECALVESTMRPETPFFSSRVQLGRDGVESIQPLGHLNGYETEIVEKAVRELAQDVQAGIDWAHNGHSQKESTDVRHKEEPKQSSST